MVTTIERESFAPAQPEGIFLKEPNGHHKDSFSLYLEEASRFLRLSQEQELELGHQIFAAKLALRSLRTMLDKNIVPAEQKSIIESLIVKGAGKNLLNTLNHEIIKRKTRTEELESKLQEEDISEGKTRQIEADRAFLEDVENNDCLTRQGLGTPSSIVPFISQKVEIFKRGNEAFNRFVNSNLLLVAFVAKRCQGKGLSLNDLVGYGHEGLMRAVAKFDYRRGYKFSTLATLWIQEAITRAIRNEASAPEYLQLAIAQLEEEQAVLEQKSSEEVKLETLAKGGVLIRGKHGEPMKVTEDTFLRGLAARRVVSLNEAVGGEGNGHETELGEFIKDGNQGPDEEAIKLCMKDQIRKALFVLSPKEKLVITLRFGLMDGKERSFEEVGKVIGRTRARAQQIEKKAFQKLRPVLAHLRDE